jgi:hypothetical protein
MAERTYKGQKGGFEGFLGGFTFFRVRFGFFIQHLQLHALHRQEHAHVHAHEINLGGERPFMGMLERLAKNGYFNDVRFADAKELSQIQ